MTDVLTALDKVLLARKTAAADSSYVASLHAQGLNKILEKVGEEALGLLLHGASERDEGREVPLALLIKRSDVAHVQPLATELTEAGADWQVHAYGNTVHAFTNPAANDATMGTVYNASADHRSWTALLNFLGEVLA